MYVSIYTYIHIDIYNIYIHTFDGKNLNLE